MSDKIYQIVTDQIIKQLESVDANDWTKPWFAVGHSPVNLRGTAYRGINHLLLSHSGYPSNIWATYKQWIEKECQVRKGEKSQLVVLWKFFKEADGEGNATGKNAGVMVKYYSVFNSEQVDGIAARTAEDRLKEKLLTHDPIKEAQAFVDAYMTSQGLPTQNSDVAYYRSGAAEHIAMPELGQFHSREHYYSTFAHEITHSTGAKKRLERDLSGNFGSKPYAFEELIAELGSAMICGTIGHEAMPREDHAQYIKSWLRELKNDNKFIIQAASKAQKAADYALEAAGLQEPADYAPEARAA